MDERSAFLDAIERAGASVDDVVERFGDLDGLGRIWRPVELFRALVCERETASRGGLFMSSAAAPSSAPLPRAAGPQRAGELVAGVLGDRRTAEMAGELSIPGALESPAGSPPPGRSLAAHRGKGAQSYRDKVRRRVAHGVIGPSAWWIRCGTHSDDVRNWLSFGWKSANATERETVNRLRREFLNTNGDRDDAAFRRIYPAASLAFLLFFIGTETRQKGMDRCVVGKPRGLLAQLLAHRSRGLPLHVSTISRLLTELVGSRGGSSSGNKGGILAGLLECWQPDGQEARRRGLPHSLHYLSGGEGTRPQAVNLYRWRSLAAEKTAGGAAGPRRGGMGDPASGYALDAEPDRRSAASTAVEVCRAPPGTSLERGPIRSLGAVRGQPEG